MSSIRYPSGSRTKHSREPPSRTEYGGRSGSMPWRQALEGRVEIVDRDRDVAVARAELVGVDAEVVGQLEPVAVAGQAHEDVDGLVADRQRPRSSKPSAS